MRETYFAAMDKIHQACVFIAGLAIVIITIIIPYGVFTRFVLNSASSWPEPLAILMMIWLSFLSAIVCYREHLHISVGMLPNALTGQSRVALGIAIELAMAATAFFMLWFGWKLCAKTWYQSIAEFPTMSVGVSYLPVPISGLITLLFVVERFMKGNWFPEPHENDDVAAQTISSE
ncbi:MAG: TRAP transporter small permease [Hyphomicrobiaceae bacterium]|nr:TRAP transporter small permease [Hyphomicrobiaceae bacterium]